MKNIIDKEYLDTELNKARARLIYFSAPEEYWMAQGKIVFIKELKEKLLELEGATKEQKE